jgi:hypothetical protein
MHQYGFLLFRKCLGQFHKPLVVASDPDYFQQKTLFSSTTTKVKDDNKHSSVVLQQKSRMTTPFNMISIQCPNIYSPQIGQDGAKERNRALDYHRDNKEI